MVHTNKDGTLTGFATCPGCKETKNLSEFHKKKSTKYGYKSTCKSCEALYRKDYYSKNKEKEDSNHSTYVDKNNKKVNSKRKERYVENHDHKRKVANSYLKEILSDRKMRVWVFALKYINRHKITDTKSTDLIGCHKEEFVKHLDKYLGDGMNWDNYGLGADKWSMDHTLPINSFNLFDPEQELKCFNYNNIKPMWFNENASKRDKILCP